MLRKDPVRTIKFTPGRHQVQTLRGQRRDRATSHQIPCTFWTFRVRQCSRTGTITRSVGHAKTMVRVRTAQALATPERSA